MIFHRPAPLRAFLFCSAIISSVAFLKGAPQASPLQPPTAETRPQTQQTAPQQHSAPQPQPQPQRRDGHTPQTLGAPPPPPANHPRPGQPKPFERLPTAPA